MLVSIQEEIESVSNRNEVSGSETSSAATQECTSQGAANSETTDSAEAKPCCDKCGEQCSCSGQCCVESVSTSIS